MKVLVACEYSGRVREQRLSARPVANFPGYLVSVDGGVFSSRKNFGFRDHYKKLSPSIDAKGYLGLTLCGPGGARRKVRIHRLVAETFIPNPDGLPCVRHLDGNQTNNAALNLAWGTYVDNEADKRGHGTYDLRRAGKLDAEDRKAIRELVADGWSQKAIAELLSVSRPTITRLLNGATWGHENEL